MGISASQARLLTITARLTSNEYESQQISNAKMRLASKSEQASRDYIAALDSKRLQYMTYDAKGDAITTDLTASAIYQYADMKNQYALSNTSGQILVSSADAKNFMKADNLDEFLAAYGIEKTYKTETLAANAAKLSNYAEDLDGGVKGYYEAWEEAINTQKLAPGADIAYQTEKAIAKDNYDAALAEYEDVIIKRNAGLNGIDVATPLKTLTEAKQHFTDTITFNNWAIAKAVASNPNEYKNAEKYYEVLTEFLSEAEDLGCTSIEDTYEYSDTSKAQWYTNLWYRMNGESTEKSSLGTKQANYAILDGKLASSSQWIQDALGQGLISLEVVSNSESATVLATELVSEKFNTQDAMKNLLGNPLQLKLNGIQWRTTQYAACTEFTEKDDEAAVARAEAEYERKNNEITAKDKKYENKIKTLDTEHNALQTEYESVQSAMNKNVERSFKAFS
ncbi:hypothetical protein IJ541_04790 [bacterium]|nr:hypothetical protein [bacterium]